jgi:hypothetical protein
MANLALETEKTRLMQQETEREMKEMFAETRAMFAETRAMFAETRLMQQKTDLQIKEVSRQLGGMGNSNGDFAEEFFYNSLKETMTFAGIHFDMISDKFRTKKIMPDKTEKKAQFDIVLHNGDSLALIEAKYKAELEDVTEMVEKKVPNFRLLYPQYEKYKLYLGIGSLVLKDRIVQEAQKLGIGLMEQRGDAVEHKNEWVRAY